jgi:biopolymer transport protein ExbD/biopolymer transport protein TolR
MLVLLIIFMVTAPILESGIEVDLPKTRTVKAVDVQKVVITIDRRQTLYLGNDAININVLGATVAQRLQGSTTTPVFIRADQSVPFGTFARVIDTLKQAGVTNINIVTEPLSTKGS